MKYSLILPAYNEGKNIGNCLKFLTSLSVLDEIIVINDGSTDDTEKIVKQYPTVILINNKENIGKTASVIKGVQKSYYDDIIFYDADLQGMKPEYMNSMIKKYEKGFDMVIMHKNKAPYFFREIIKSLPAQSGTRILKKEVFLKVGLDTKKSWDLEPKINEYYLNNNLTISFTDAEGVYDPRKFKKYSLLDGIIRDIKSFFDIMFLFGFWGIPRNFGIMWKIHQLYKNSNLQT